MYNYYFPIIFSLFFDMMNENKLKLDFNETESFSDASLSSDLPTEDMCSNITEEVPLPSSSAVDEAPYNTI